MDEGYSPVLGYHKNPEDPIGNIFDVFLWVLKQMNFIVVSHWGEMDGKIWPWKNQHTYLEKAPKEEKTPAIAVFFLKKSPKYLILSGLVKLVEKNHPLIPMENKRLDNITKTQFL